jgi:hypothetical protein
MSYRSTTWTADLNNSFADINADEVTEVAYENIDLANANGA